MSSPHGEAVAQAPLSAPDWWTALQPYLVTIPARNPGTAALSERAQGTRRAASAAAALPDPMVVVGVQSVPTDGSFDREPMTQAPVIGVSQKIPYPGKLAARAAVTRADAVVLDQHSRAQAELRGFELVAASFTAVQLREERAFVQETIEWFELLANSAQARYRAGRGLGQDVDQIRVDIGRLRAEESRLAAAIVAAESEWQRILGVPMPSHLAFERGRPWFPQSDITDVIAEANPAYRVAVERLLATSERLREARSLYGPDFSIEFSYGVRQDDRQDFLSGRVGVSVPLWAPWSQRARVEGARQAVVAAELEQTDARLSAAAKLDAALASLGDAQRRELLYVRVILPDAEAARGSAAGAYEAGAVDIFVPIEATRRELTSRREFVGVVAARRVAEARIFVLAGHLVGGAGDSANVHQSGVNP